MNEWLLILRDSAGTYLVATFSTRMAADAVAFRYKGTATIAIVVNLDELVEQLTGHK